MDHHDERQTLIKSTHLKLCGRRRQGIDGISIAWSHSENAWKDGSQCDHMCQLCILKHEIVIPYSKRLILISENNWHLGQLKVK